jgi:hypothetical protein
MANGKRRLRSRIKENHAALRAAERYENVSLQAIRLEILAGRMGFLMRQTASRSLVRVRVNEQWVYLVLNRAHRTVVTVLSPEQATASCGSSTSTTHARTLRRMEAASSST